MSLPGNEMLRDARNLALLRLMCDNPRITISELARRIEMSAPAVRERVLKLEEAGVIRGYRMELDPTALGFPVVAFVRVRPMPGQLQAKIATLAKRLPQVAECHRVTGEDCFIMKVHFERLDAGAWTSSLTSSSPTDRRRPPLCNRLRSPHAACPCRKRLRPELPGDGTRQRSGTALIMPGSRVRVPPFPPDFFDVFFVPPSRAHECCSHSG